MAVDEHDLRYCMTVLYPEAKRLEAEQWRCVGLPWRYFRWRRAHKAHEDINEQWRAILDGREHAPSAPSHPAETGIG